MVQQGITGDARAHMGPTGAAEAGPAMTRTSRRSKADSMTPAACVCGLGESRRLGKETHDGRVVRQIRREE
jgi:hypothetical protein